MLRSDELVIVTRDEWGAAPTRNTAPKLQVLPPSYVIISETSIKYCLRYLQCIKVRSSQSVSVRITFAENIPYNFLVGIDGFVYEGRGWDVQGDHTCGYNNRSIGISFIGIFGFEEPSETQLQAAMQLIKFGVENGKISKDYILKGERQVTLFSHKPGDLLYNIINKWEHWDPWEISIDCNSDEFTI